MTNNNATRLGLRDVIAGDTLICRLDEQQSMIYYYGYSIDELVEKHTFEEVAYLTLFGELPESGSFRFSPPNIEALNGIWKTLQTEPATPHPMGLLRTTLSSLGNRLERQGTSGTYEADREESLELVPHVGYAVGQIGRYIEQKDWIRPVDGNTYGENILLMLRGHQPDAFEAKAMDVALTLYTEHEFNAGSFATRIAASAHADVYSAAIAGECTLRGPRHGSANEESMKLMLDIGTPDRVKEYCDAFFSQSGARLPGFGHAVYNLPHSHDPRVDVLRPWVHELSKLKGEMRWYETALALEDYMTERMRPRVAAGQPNAPANMDLWTAPLYYLMGLPIPLYTPLFAASRIAGWAAHYLEVKYVNNEPIIRPRADYLGPELRQYTPDASHGATEAKNAG